MRKLKIKHIINTTIILWLFVWLYYMVFNWEVFSINLKTNLGFATIGSYPFIFFFIIGLIILILIRYFEQSIAIRKLSEEKDRENKIALLEKDIEVLKLKETLFKMQSEEMSRNNATLNALHKRLDEIATEIEQDKESDQDSNKSKGPEKDINTEKDK